MHTNINAKTSEVPKGPGLDVGDIFISDIYPNTLFIATTQEYCVSICALNEKGLSPGLVKFDAVERGYTIVKDIDMVIKSYI